jgi:hypothetical protein
MLAVFRLVFTSNTTKIALALLWRILEHEYYDDYCGGVLLYNLGGNQDRSTASSLSHQLLDFSSLGCTMYGAEIVKMVYS